MLIFEFLKQAKSKLPLNGDFLGVEVLLAFVLNKNREYLISSPNKEISENEQEHFLALFEGFLEGEPVAYLINNKEFFGLDFFVDNRVLIPRPETELLIEKVLEFVKENKIVAPKILDIGTGSGCIPISILKNLPEATSTAIDISLEALEVAKINVEKHGLMSKIKLFQSDLLEKIEEDFDIITANLPYIGEKRFNFVSNEAKKFEPNIALFGGEDGLKLYTKLFEQLIEKKIRFKLLIGEFGFLQSDEIRNLLNKFFPGTKFEICEDYARIERIFIIKRS